MGTDILNTLIECRWNPFEAFQCHSPGNIRYFTHILSREQGHGAHRSHGLGSIDQAQTFLWLRVRGVATMLVEVRRVRA